MTAPVYLKDPDATAPFTIDWSDYLAGDTIATSSWSVPSGITAPGNDKDTTTTTVYLAGGTAGQSYMVTNTITTNTDQITEQRSLIIRVRDNP